MNFTTLFLVSMTCSYRIDFLNDAFLDNFLEKYLSHFFQNQEEYFTFSIVDYLGMLFLMMGVESFEYSHINIDTGNVHFKISPDSKDNLFCHYQEIIQLCYALEANIYDDWAFGLISNLFKYCPVLERYELLKKKTLKKLFRKRNKMYFKKYKCELVKLHEIAKSRQQSYEVFIEDFKPSFGL